MKSRSRDGLAAKGLLLSVEAQGQTRFLLGSARTVLASLQFFYSTKECSKQEWNPSQKKYSRLKTSLM